MSITKYQGVYPQQQGIDYSGGYSTNPYYSQQPDYMQKNPTAVTPAPSMLQNIGYGADAIAGLANAYTSYQGLKLAKKQYELGKASTLANYRQNANNYNASIKYRQQMRLANANAANQAHPGTGLQFQGVNDYMQQYGANTDMLKYAQGYQPPVPVAQAPQGQPTVPNQGSALAAATLQGTYNGAHPTVASNPNAASNSHINQQKLKSI